MLSRLYCFIFIWLESSTLVPAKCTYYKFDMWSKVQNVKKKGKMKEEFALEAKSGLAFVVFKETWEL